MGEKDSCGSEQRTLLAEDVSFAPGAAQELGPSPKRLSEPYLAAFIEGKKGPSATPDEGTAQMIKKMEGSGSFNLMTLFLGPSYWAWRRCYAEAALFALCVWVLMPLGFFFGMRMESAAVIGAAAFLFYPMYRKRAMRVYRKAFAAYGNDPERVIEAMRTAGGTSWGGFVVASIFGLASLGASLWFIVGPLIASYSL